MIKFHKNVNLSNFTTFRIGGIANYLVNVKTKRELREAIIFSKRNKLPIFVIGEGSDILISDNKFQCLIIRLVNKEIIVNGKTVISGAGVKWDDLVKKCVHNKLQGVECLSGIPGTVGAAPVQNIGAYGQELKDTFVKAEVFDIKTNRFLFLTNSECNFGYRESIFKKDHSKGRYIIFKVFLKLNKKFDLNIKYDSLAKYISEKHVNKINLTEIRNAVLQLRKQKLPDPKIIPNAGSFFKNPVVNGIKIRAIQKKFPDIPYFENNDMYKLFSGWLIEQCGWKGKKFGKVGVSDKNALVLVNMANGSAEEVRRMSEEITNDVFKKFGIKLEKEVQFVNF